MAEILTPDDERRIIEAVLLLGMTPPFTVEAARDQYRRLARIYHPDAGRTADAERFKALGEAVRTVEAHAAAFASGGLAWNAGGASGGARASQAAQLLEKLSAAEMTIVQKDSELHRLRLERDFAARQTAEKKRRGPSAGVIFTGYVLLLGVVAIMGVLLAAKSQPREATLEAFEVMLDPVTVEVSLLGAKGSATVRGNLQREVVRVSATRITSDAGSARVSESTGTAAFVQAPHGEITSLTLQGKILPQWVRVEPAALLDWGNPNPQAWVYAVLKNVWVEVGERPFSVDVVKASANAPRIEAALAPPPVSSVISGEIQVRTSPPKSPDPPIALSDPADDTTVRVAPRDRPK